jgi:hypothetical protein
VLIGVLCVAALHFAACSSGPSRADGYSLSMTHAWADVTDSNHIFLLVSADDGKSEGTFSGTEFVGAFDPQGNSLNGQWGNNSIQFTVRRPSGSVAYRGTLTSDGQTQLTFTSSTGSLAIRQQ